MKVTVRIAGEAGQGLVTAGDLLVKLLTAYNVHIFTNRAYMSRIRGGLNWYDITVSEEKVYSPSETSDFLIALSEDSLAVLKDYNKEEQNIFFNSKAPETSKSDKVNFIDFEKEAENKIMISTYTVGLIIGRLNFDSGLFKKNIRKIFDKTNGKSASKNISALEKGYSKGLSLAGKIKFSNNKETPAYTVKGADAIAISAAVSGVKFAASYPMTPGTATFTRLAELSDKFKILIEQAEDELAAVNMICGAGYAGIPAMACTSGGGFALMCEGVSLSGMLEIPILIMVAQRPGPATGLPTRTAQEDLKFAVNAGHGEFPKAVFAPGTLEECYSLTRKALETAHKYQSPVVLLTDQYLQDHIENTEAFDMGYNPIARHIEENPENDYHRYAVTKNGISPRAVPGKKTTVVSDSHEHNLNGHITEDLNIRLCLQNKRMRKLSGMIEESIPPALYGVEDAEELFICWGSTYGPCREAVDTLNQNGTKSDMLHFSQVWPLNREKIDSMIKYYNRVYVVEGNSTGQLGLLLKETGVISAYDLIARYDGLPITAEYIVSKKNN